MRAGIPRLRRDGGAVLPANTYGKDEAIDPAAHRRYLWRAVRSIAKHPKNCNVHLQFAFFNEGIRPGARHELSLAHQFTGTLYQLCQNF